jgi:SARP family transcriptional regulator, regulator of embCAB operon
MQRPLARSWISIGETLESRARIYLAGNVSLRHGDLLIERHQFPGGQSRLAFAYLALERRRPVLRDELAHVLWADAPPGAADGGLNAILSKLRRLLAVAGLGESCLTSRDGYYQLRLPGAWVDVETALDEVHNAEAALRVGTPSAAYGSAAVVYHIARRPFLAGEEGIWVEHWRQRLRDVLARSLECLAHVYIGNGDAGVAADLARQVVELEPFRETGYQLLMRAHAAAGNRAEALRVYEQCRRLIAEELGVDPSAETHAVYLRVLAAS